jgi:hypothetical protein
MDTTKISEGAYKMYTFLMLNNRGEVNSIKAYDLGVNLGLTGNTDKVTRQVRLWRSEINDRNSTIEVRVLSSNKGYYIPVTMDDPNLTIKQYKKTAYRKIKSGVAQILEGKALLNHAKLEGQILLPLVEMLKEVIEISVSKDLPNEQELETRFKQLSLFDEVDDK